MIIKVIETERLIIREFKEDDFIAVHEYGSRPEVTKYLPFGPNSKEDTRLFLKKVTGFTHQNPRSDYEFAVVLKKNNTLIGGLGIHITNSSNKEASIGYCYDRPYWGNGYGSEAARAILGFGFKELKLHRIFATCHPDNIGSARVMEKIGMQKEGRLRENRFQKGIWRDSLIYSILQYEYEGE